MFKTDGSLTEGRDFKEISLWSNVSTEEWNDWHWQLRNRITDVEELSEVIDLTSEEEENISNSLNELRMAITPYFATLMDPSDRSCPIRRRAVPTGMELEKKPEDILDPLHEDEDSPVPGITHRYPDRILFLITDQCGMYCRHCTRRRQAGETDKPMPREMIDKGIEYVRKSPEVRDVLLSGGDPLTVSNDRLEYVLDKLYEIPHVEMLRIGSNVPVVLPQRITPELLDLLGRYQPLYINTHFNHPKEITEASKEACEKLADGGFVLGNQSVLLKGVNDSPIVMKKLVQDLLRMRVRPYYIYQCDLSKGLSHFRTSVGKGIEIMENLRGYTSGLAVPTYIVDTPGGGGKVPVTPNYVVSRSDRRVVLRNYEGVLISYTEPGDEEEGYEETPGEEELREQFPNLVNEEGPSPLLRGDRLVVEPEDLERHQREG
ncbi:lysine 2,3-aminomutase [Candidatus Bipolaricaulota bacterium]|nr:lysine 2,3-aminomutase [Candidatus Bipolaricaulota bacterium]